jgi:branched-chain amino acid transport system substrate-binding protein
MSVPNRSAVEPARRRHPSRLGRLSLGRTLAAAATAVLLTAAAACSSSAGSSSSGGGGSSGGSSAATAGAYKVGIISDLTGADAGASAQIADGAMTAFDLVNSQGGVDGHKISYSTGDTQSTPTGAEAATRQALGGSPIAMLQATSGLTLSAALPLLEGGAVPVIAANDYGLPNYSWMWGAVMTEAQLNTSLFNGVVEAAGGSVQGKKIAMVFIDVPANHTAAADLTTMIKAKGGTVSTVQYVAPGTASFSSGAAQVVSTGTQALLIEDAIPSVILEAKALKSAGYAGPIVLSYNAADNGTMAQINSPNVLSLRPYEYPDTDSQLYKWAVQFKHAQDATTEGFSRGFVMGEMLIAGLKKCGSSCTATSLKGAMDNVGAFTVPGNIMNFGTPVLSASQRNPLTGAGVFKYDPATKKGVDQATVKIGPPDYPAAQ